MYPTLNKEKLLDLINNQLLSEDQLANEIIKMVEELKSRLKVCKHTDGSKFAGLTPDYDCDNCPLCDGTGITQKKLV